MIDPREAALTAELVKFNRTARDILDLERREARARGKYRDLPAGYADKIRELEETLNDILLTLPAQLEAAQIIISTSEGKNT